MKCEPCIKSSNWECYLSSICCLCVVVHKNCLMNSLYPSVSLYSMRVNATECILFIWMCIWIYMCAMFRAQIMHFHCWCAAEMLLMCLGSFVCYLGFCQPDLKWMVLRYFLFFFSFFLVFFLCDSVLYVYLACICECNGFACASIQCVRYFPFVSTNIFVSCFHLSNFNFFCCLLLFSLKFRCMFSLSNPFHSIWSLLTCIFVKRRWYYTCNDWMCNFIFTSHREYARVSFPLFSFAADVLTFLLFIFQW